MWIIFLVVIPVLGERKAYLDADGYDSTGREKPRM